MKRILFAVLALLLTIPAFAAKPAENKPTMHMDEWVKLYPELVYATVPRTIDWSYDNSCSSTALAEFQYASEMLDRLLVNVTINYQGYDATGFNYTDNKNTLSCHDQTWFNDGSGAYHKVSQAGSGAFVDHSGSSGARTFDMAFNTAYMGSTPPIYDAALHEWIHVIALDHPADYWSAVYGCPFGGCGTANPYHFGWMKYPTNDDIVGMSAFYAQVADCAPYVDEDDKLYFPYLPTTTGTINPSVVGYGHWAVLQMNPGHTTATLLDYDLAHIYYYGCTLSYSTTSGGTITGTAFKQTTGAGASFTMTNADSTGATITNWNVSGL